MLPLSPVAYNTPVEGLCAEHISPLLLTYYPPLKGVVMSYSNERISEGPRDRIDGPEDDDDGDVALGRSQNEYAVSYLWLTADFLLFRPQRGKYLEGKIVVHNESMLAVVCWNCFNAVIQKDQIPKEWEWVEDGKKKEVVVDKKKNKQREEDEEELPQAPGHWVDGDGKKVEGKIVFRVLDFEADRGGENDAGSIGILGTLLDPQEGEAMMK